MTNRENANPAMLQTSVGDDACIVPGAPVLPQTPTGGPWPSPTNRGKRRGQPGNHKLHNTANLCRGRCSHRPADLAPPRTPAGGINPAPTNKFYTLDQKPQSPALRPEIPPAEPRAAANRADMESAPTGVCGIAGSAFSRVATGFAPVRRGGIYPARGCSRRREVRGTMRASSPTEVCVYARLRFASRLDVRHGL